MHIKQRHYIQKSEIKALKEEVLKQYNEQFLNQLFPKKASIELIQTEKGDTLYAINKELKIWKTDEDGYIPVLTFLLNNKVKIKSIVVDMGAIRYVANGADVMRPGITRIDPSIKKDNIVQIIDETHDRTIAVGKAMYNAKEMEEMKEGKVVKNLHTIQDSIWKFEKEFR
ncbi:MAG: PUA domain-containing protein [Candidatus Heimdallarchaeota archaeon]